MVTCSPAFSYGVQAGSIVAGDSFGTANFSAAGTTVGTHAITLSGLANANYDVTFQPGTLTVTKRAITFKADDVTRIYGDASPAFSYGVQAGQHRRRRQLRHRELLGRRAPPSARTRSRSAAWPMRTTT